MQQHRVKGQRHPLTLGRVQRQHRLTLAVVPGLDASEQQRILAERHAARLALVGLAEIGLLHRLLMLDAEQCLARLRVGLGADARARLLGELHQ